MLSVKEFSSIINKYPIYNHCFSLIGGLTILETDYLEKLLKFNNHHPVFKLCSLLFNKSQFCDLSTNSLFNTSELTEIIFYIHQYYSSKDKTAYQDKINNMLRHGLFSKYNKNNIETLQNLILTKQKDHFLIYYIFQAYISKTITCIEDYLEYYRLCNNFIINHEYFFSKVNQRQVISILTNRHYSSGIMQLCYTRLVLINSQNIIFPDCCITSLRNFVNNLIYDPVNNIFNVDLFHKVKLDINSNIIEFYENNQNIECIQNQSVHNIWADLTKGLNKYDKMIAYNSPQDNPICELLPGVVNMLSVCKVVLGSNDLNNIVNKFNEFRAIKLSIDTSSLNINTNNIVDYKNKVVLSVNNENLNWYFLKQHFRTDKTSKNESIVNERLLLENNNTCLLTILLRNSNKPPDDSAWANNYDISDLFYLLSFCMRTPEDSIELIYQYTKQKQLIICEFMQQMLSKIFIEIPNDAYHLYNKYALLDALNKSSHNLIEYLNIDEEQSYYEQYY
tara:strand:+ start:17693 stop:19210 length:1518 start_codon:yes stop_codon:yes gene_type:complete